MPDREARPGETARGRLALLRGRGPVLVVALGVLAQAVISFVLTKDGWFFLDTWHYVLHRVAVPEADLGLFESWGGHWQLVPILLYEVWWPVFGLHSYLPYIAVAITLHLVISVLLFQVLRTVGVRPWIAVVTTWALLFFGAGSEAWLWDGPIPLVLGLALVSGALLVALHRDFDARGLLVATLLLVTAVMTSAVGLIGCVLLGSLAAFRFGWQTMLRVAGPPLGLFVLWFLLVGRDSERIRLHGWDYARIPEYVWAGMTAAFENLFAIPGSGAVLLVVLVAVPFLARDVDVRLRQLAWAGILAGFAEMTLASVASLTFGPGSTDVSRYQYLVVALFLPSIAIALTLLVDRVRASVPDQRAVAGLAAAALLVGYTVNGLLHERYESHYIESAASFPKAWVLGTRDALADGQTILTARPAGPAAGDMDMELIATPQVLASLPDTPSTVQQRVDAEAQVFVAVGPEALGLPTAADLESPSFTVPVRPGPGCATYEAEGFEPRISFDAADGAEIRVTSESSEVEVLVVRDGVLGEPRTWPVEAGEATYVSTSVKDAVVVATFDAGGTYQICV